MIKKSIKKLFLEQSLSLKIIFYIGAVLIVAIMISIYLNKQTHEKGMLDLIQFQYFELSNTIKTYLRFNMLKHSSIKDIQEIFETIGYREDIINISVIHDGKIKLSSWREEVGIKKNLLEKECRYCHIKEDSDPITVSAYWHYKDDMERSIIEIVHPIENEPICHRCHDSNKQILGALYFKVYNKKFDHLLASGKKHTIISFLIIFLLVSIEIGYFIYKFVHIPIQKLKTGTTKIAEGNLNYHIDIKSSDEIGDLANSFNIMTDHIKKSREEIEMWNLKLEKKVLDATYQLKKTNEELIQTNRRLKFADKKKSEILIAVANNLKGPISAITTCIDVVLNGYLDNNLEKRNEMMKRVRVRLEELLKFISDLMDLSALQNSEIKFKKINSDLLFDNILEKIRVNAAKREIKIITNKSEYLLSILCDQELLNKAIVYIADNAIRYSPKDSEIYLDIEALDDSLLCKIKDNGIGIPDEELPCIFDLTFRGTSALRHSTEGMGVSLSLVKRIVEIHKGKIKVNSTKGMGTVVTVQIPLASDQCPAPA